MDITTDEKIRRVAIELNYEVLGLSATNGGYELEINVEATRLRADCFRKIYEMHIGDLEAVEPVNRGDRFFLALTVR